MPVDAGTINAQVRVNSATLKTDIAKANASLDQLGQNNKTRASNFSKVWTTAFAGYAAAGVAAITAVSVAFKKSIGVFAEFEQSLARVRAVTGATREEFKGLEDAAAEAGKTTRFTATQAADALFFLASAGFDAAQSIDALDGVLQLAGATGSDLASTASTVTAVISQFGLEAAEAARISNVFAAANQNSQATLEKLTGAFRQVGPVAAGLGISLEETTGALQILFNAGFQGENAGRALKSALADLSNAAGPASKKLETLGLNLEKLDPSANSLAEVIGVLGEASLSTGEILDVFGKVAGPQVATLLKEGRGELEAYTAAVTDTNAAAESYAIQNDTLLGSVDRFKSAAQGLGIELGEILAPYMRDVVDAGIQIIGFLVDALPFVSGFIDRVATLVPAILALRIAFSGTESVAERFAEGIDATAESLAAANDALKSADSLENQRKELDLLIKDYELLSDRTDLNVEEQRRLAVVVSTLADTVPEAATAFDEFGEAIEFNTGIAKDASKELLELEKAQKDAALGILTAEKDIADERAKALEFEVKASKKDFETAQKRLQFTSRRVATARAIEAEYFAARTRAGDDLVKLTEAQSKAAQKLVEAGLIPEDVYQEAGANAKGLTTLLATFITPLKEDYKELTKNVDEQFEAWQEIEGEIKRSTDLTLEIKRLEAELLGINQGLAQANEDVADSKDKTVRKTAEEIQAERELALARAEFNEELARRLFEQSATRLEILERDYQEELEKAEKLGADKQAIEEFYAEERKRVSKEEEERKDKERDEELNKDFAKYEKGLEQIQFYYSLAADVANQFFDALTELSRVQTENRLLDLEEQTTAQLEALEAEKAAALEAAGFREETEVQRLQNELDAAIASGDNATADDLRQKLEREKIEQDFADKQAAIEKKASDERKKLEYEGALAAWQLKLAGAIATAPLTIINAINTGFGAGFPAGLVLGPALGVAAGVATGIQIAAIASAKPRKPALATGGIAVPKAGGAEVIVAENNSPELMLNAGASGAGFLNMFADKIAERIGGRSDQRNVSIIVDRRAIAEAVAVEFNTKNVRLEL